MGACNEIGNLAMEEALKQLDTDGIPIKFGGVKMTVRVKDSLKPLSGAVKKKCISNIKRWKMSVGGQSPNKGQH